MSFPYNFVKLDNGYIPNNDVEMFNLTVNLGLSNAILSVGGISLAYISSIALKVLGFSAMTTKIVTAIPIVAAAMGIYGVLGATGILIYLMIKLAKEKGQEKAIS